MKCGEKMLVRLGCYDGEVVGAKVFGRQRDKRSVAYGSSPPTSIFLASGDFIAGPLTSELFLNRP